MYKHDKLAMLVFLKLTAGMVLNRGASNLIVVKLTKLVYGNMRSSVHYLILKDAVDSQDGFS